MIDLVNYLNSNKKFLLLSSQIGKLSLSLYPDFSFDGENICKKYSETILGKTARFRTVFKNMV